MPKSEAGDGGRQQANETPPGKVPIILARLLIESELPKRPSVNNARPRPSTCDIVIVILWARMGTPLDPKFRKPDGAPYLSGTEWEYLDAIGSTWTPKPVVLVYRRTEKLKIVIDDVDFDEKRAQFRQVEAFFTQFRNPAGSLAGGVNEYATPAEFKGLLAQHLEEIVHRRLPLVTGEGKPRPPAATIPEQYLDSLRRSLERVELLGAKEGRSVTLNSVYVPALTPPPTGEPAMGKRWEKKQPDEAEDRKPIPLLQRLDQESLYVPAAAGAGKSTFCRWAVLQSIAGADLTHPVPAPEEFAEPVPGNLRGRLPLLIPLREFWRSMPCGRGERE